MRRNVTFRIGRHRELASMDVFERRSKVGVDRGADRCCVGSRQAGPGGGGTYWIDARPEPSRIHRQRRRPTAGGPVHSGLGGRRRPRARPVDVLFFQCGAFLGAALTGDSRPGVAKVLHVSRNDFGFSGSFSKQRCSQDRPGALVLTQDQHYAVIGFSTP
jgi:hypothetical protein